LHIQQQKNDIRVGDEAEKPTTKLSVSHVKMPLQRAVFPFEMPDFVAFAERQ